MGASPCLSSIQDLANTATKNWQIPSSAIGKMTDNHFFVKSSNVQTKLEEGFFDIPSWFDIQKNMKNGTACDDRKPDNYFPEALGFFPKRVKTLKEFW